MLKSLLSAGVIAFGMVGPRMAQERIRILSDWGEVTADLADNEAAKSLAQMLPLTIEMSDHLRQEEDR
ncbi:cyclophilin-like fold protein [Mesorhizobium sp. M1182]|uniref:cyclophilin-like fold protein n=1 Tax=Mesorhizobium sp. M1182 TaxID=2957067 RepID=UPI003337585A